MRGEFVDIGGARVYCYASGSRGVGDPIVLVHGAFTSSHLWKDVLPRLPKGHRVLVLDLLGHGRSDPPRGSAMTIAAHADRLTALLDVMGVPVASLVGHGIGAAIAALVASQVPARVAGLALVNPTFLVRNPRQARVNGQLSRVAMLVPLWRKLAPEWLASALHAALLPAYVHRSAGAHSLDLYLKTFRSRDGRDAACAQLQALKLSRSDAAGALEAGALTCPVALVLGDSDPWLPASKADALADVVRIASGGRLMVQRVPGVAHVAPEEAPDRLGTLVAELIARQARSELRIADATSATSATAKQQQDDSMTDRLEAMRAMVARAPDNALARFGFANELLKAGLRDDAATELGEYLARFDDEGAGWLRYADTLYDLGRENEARAAVARGMDAASRYGHGALTAEFEARLDDWG